MRLKARSERGMSLVEVTIILMVLALLTAVLAPSIGDYVNDARQTKAKEDVEALGTAIVRMVRDTGGRCVRLLATAKCTVANRADILRSTGPDVDVTDLNTTAGDYTAPTAADITSTSINWDEDDDVQSDTFDNQLVINTPLYDVPADGSPTGWRRSGPWVAGVGWRGAYLGSVEVDPWGSVYLANTVFLAVGIDATAGNDEGNRSGGWSRDTIVISAGPDGMFDTPFGGSDAGDTPAGNAGTNRFGDDILFVVNGDTR